LNKLCRVREIAKSNILCLPVTGILGKGGFWKRGGKRLRGMEICELFSAHCYDGGWDPGANR
jgi:hypothetical protein